jgi:hypothetical protein
MLKEWKALEKKRKEKKRKEKKKQCPYPDFGMNVSPLA